MQRSIYIGLLSAMFIFSMSDVVQAQTGELASDKIEIAKAKVLEIKHQEVKNVPGTNISNTYQTIEVQILDGSEKDKVVTVENDYLNLNLGEIFYLSHTTSSFDGKDYYSVNEPYRLPQILILIGIFIVILFLFGGMQGVRGLISLMGSFLLIIFVLLPGILHGYSPILMTFGVSSLIIILGSYITHGFNKTTSSAVIGMIFTVAITGLLAYWAVHFARLSGFGAEEVTYLNLDTSGSIDILGLLLGGIMIGLLGVLYDVAIGQAVSVEELLTAAPDISKKTLYQRAIRIGREHIGALVNTLAIAYVGVALPLLLLFYISNTGGIAQMVNREIFSAEIVRIMIGSIGLILAVPITTLVSVWFLTRKK